MPFAGYLKLYIDKIFHAVHVPKDPRNEGTSEKHSELCAFKDT